jgi:twitching motility two-component system response regulator PilH
MPNARLLVLCGNAERKESLVRELSNAGWHDILSASSMAEAAKTVRDAASACIIVDAQLQDIPGLKAVPILRNLCEQAKVIFCTAENTRELEAQARALDVFYYYVSSADSEELLAAVRDAVGAPARGRAGRLPKVLIVDDDPDFQKALRAILTPAGYCTASAFSKQEGLEAARREAPDVILLDIMMQTTTDGFEFYHEAARDPFIKHTPILGISAIENILEGQRPSDFDPDLFPVDGYLSKPVSPEKLLSELKRLIPAEP